MSKALKEKEWWPDLMKISFEAWEKFNETIAAEVSDEVWIEIFGARQSCSFMDTMRNKSVAEGTNFFWSDPYLVAGYTSMLDDLKRGSSALSPLAFPDSRSQKKREERVTMKSSFWIVGLLATLLQLAGLLCGSYGVLRESFVDLAQARGYGEVRGRMAGV